jgi:hypothetical protein
VACFSAADETACEFLVVDASGDIDPGALARVERCDGLTDLLFIKLAIDLAVEKFDGAVKDDNFA